MTRKHVFPPYEVEYRKPCHEMEYRKPCPEPKHAKETIVKCGMGVSPGPLCNSGLLAGGASSVPGPIGGSPCSLIASVTLDTSDLEDPVVKIDFSSLISFRTYAAVAGYYLHLVIKLSRVCDCGHSESLGTWTFEKSFSTPVHTNGVAPAQIDGEYTAQEIVPFGFTWCECDGCPGCCTYRVELVEQDCYDIDFATISNIYITGIAQGIKRY